MIAAVLLAAAVVADNCVIDAPDDGNARDVVLTIDNLAGEPLSVDLRIVVMDPLEH